jgi:type II secretory pathway pseudopilin PulG
MLQTPKNTHSSTFIKGFTIVELMLTVFIILILFLVLIIYVSPSDQRKRARDLKRLSDLLYLEDAILQYREINGILPDNDLTLRISTELPTGNSGPLQSSTSGWLLGDFSDVADILPIDPINDDEYFYSYYRDGPDYELNLSLELLDKGESDGGNDSSVYESGSLLTLL